MNDWKVVSQAEMATAMKARNAKQEKSYAALEALSKLAVGEAIRIAFPKEKRFAADAMRCRCVDPRAAESARSCRAAHSDRTPPGRGAGRDRRIREVPGPGPAT